VPLLVQIIGALIINPTNIIKRKESIRTLYAQYLSTNVNDETVLKFKKELVIQIKDRLAYLMNAFKDFDKEDLSEIMSYILFNDKDNYALNLKVFKNKKDLYFLEIYSGT